MLQTPKQIAAKRSPVLPTSIKDYARPGDEDEDRELWSRMWQLAAHIDYRRAFEDVKRRGIDPEFYSVQFKDNPEHFPSVYLFSHPRYDNRPRKELVWVEVMSDDKGMMSWKFGERMSRYFLYDYKKDEAIHHIDIYPGNDPRLVERYNPHWENGTEIPPSALVNDF